MNKPNRQLKNETATAVTGFSDSANRQQNRSALIFPPSGECDGQENINQQ
jgi:hypothetical protein